MDIESFIEKLKHHPVGSGVFNPWYDVDKENDINEACPRVRRHQLSAYLIERIGQGATMLVGEALGYQGGHFTGIAMTSERILLGGQNKNGISPDHVFTNITPQRTSRPEVKTMGFSEPTATIVWGHLINAGLDPQKFILWNAFPWHPYNTKKGMLSNRTPTESELKTGVGILNQLIDITGAVNIIAVGEKSIAVLRQAGIDATKVRHPANGGAAKFKMQFQEVLTLSQRT